MTITEPIIYGNLVRRYARFLMDLSLPDGSVVTVHCPNSGSMEGCLLEGALVLASKAANPARRFRYTAEYIRLPTGWVGINTHRTNLIVGEALRARALPELAAYTEIQAEVPYGNHSRVDFLLSGPGVEALAHRVVFDLPSSKIGEALPLLKRRGKTLVPLAP